MSLKDFIGNASVIQTLESQLREDRLPNTLLFAGPSGIGKGTLARSLAKSLNCREVQYDFCNQCSSCRKIEANTHPDVRVYSPEGQFIKIDQMRELSREAFFRPFEGRQRIFILEQADRLKIEAANSILKTIEEPPESTTILLLSDKPNDLLSTIRSRAQLYQFIPLPFETMASWLAVETGRSKEDCQLLARLAGGALGKALQTDMDDYRQTRQESLDLLRSCRADFLYVRVGRILETWASRKEAEKEKFGFRMEILYTLLHDLFLLKHDDSSESITNVDIREPLQSLATSFTQQQLTNGTRLLDRLEQGARRNLNKGLILDSLVFNLSGTLIDPKFILER